MNYNLFPLVLCIIVKKYFNYCCTFNKSKKSSNNPIDPSCFLDAFSRFMVSMGRDDFVVNSQQDVPEVLNYLLYNFCGISVLSQEQIKVVIRHRITTAFKVMTGKIFT